jgi:uncharacterized membrane protein
MIKKNILLSLSGYFLMVLFIFFISIISTRAQTQPKQNQEKKTLPYSDSLRNLMKAQRLILTKDSIS